jgi:alkylation response protein AidB-like acyl-CoA dehydrogenase
MMVSLPPVAPDEPRSGPEAEGREWQTRAREFAAEIVRPAGRALDRLDAQQAVSPGSPLFDFLAQAQREGFTRLTDPVCDGGLGLSRADEYAVLEELATADAGLATVVTAAPEPFRQARAAGSDRLAASLAEPWFALERLDWSGCCATRGCVRATRNRDGWFLAGSTSPWVTGAACASHALVVCAVDDVTSWRHCFAIVPLDRPGVTRGPAVDLLGLRTQARTRIAFDNVRMTADELLPGPVGALRAMEHAATAIAAVGVARAAYEGSLRLVQDEVEGRGTRAQRDAAQRRLLRMFTLLQAARSLARAVHLHAAERLDAGVDCTSKHAFTAQAFATDAALRIVDASMDICGSRADASGGVEYPDGSTFQPEKLLRDAQTFKAARSNYDRPAPVPAAHH